MVEPTLYDLKSTRYIYEEECVICINGLVPLYSRYYSSNALVDRIAKFDFDL